MDKKSELLFDYLMVRDELERANIIIGEIDRIVRYGELGYIEREPVLVDVYAHYLDVCQRLGRQDSGSRCQVPGT